MDFTKYFLLFMMYSTLGWIMEVTCKLFEKKKFINRGFLIGPYCPIYGFGCLGMIILLKKYLNDPLALFVMATVICSILEYATSYIMEKLFNARWWDYKNKKYNINGRVCLETMLPFGILGCLVMYFINPFFTTILNHIPSTILNIIAIILLLIFIVDNIVSFNIISNFKTSFKYEDNTEEITKKVKDILFKKSILNRRLIHAFPNIEEKIKKIKERIRT